MNIADVKQTLRGPLIPVITNLKDDLSIDHDAIRENVEYVVERGIVKGQGVLLAVGAGGDFPVLSVAERKSVAKTIQDAAAGRTPVLVGAQDTNVNVMVEMAQWADEIGAYGIQMSPGYYYKSMDAECLRVFETVHNATSNIALMIYNTPWEGYNMSLDQIARLVEFPRCVGLKWQTSDGVSAYMRGVTRFADSLAVVCNSGLHVMNHILGGTGYITHLATVWPEHELEVWRLLEARDYESAQKKITATNWLWSDFRRKMWNSSRAESPVVKAALDICGRPGGSSRIPTRALNEQECAELKRLLTHIGVPGAD